MKNLWSLHVAGTGSIDQAKDVLTQFVSKMRDVGCKITDVRAIDGTYHSDLTQELEQTGEPGWTIVAYGEGTVAPAYKEFPTFLRNFEDIGMKVQQSGILEGALREDLLPAGSTRA